GITVSVQVFFSLLAARFGTPVLAAYFLKDHPHAAPPPGRVFESYTLLVTWSVQHYLITVLIGFGVFAASIWSITLLPRGFLPAQDTARSLLALELPPGTQLAFTENVTEDIVALLRKRPEVRSVFVDGGRVPPGTHEVRRAALIINYTGKTERDITQRHLELEIGQQLENVPDIRYWFLDENGLRAISLVVTGADSNIVSNVASELATQMKRIPIISDVISETSLDRPELRIQPKAYLAARLGGAWRGHQADLRIAGDEDAAKGRQGQSFGRCRKPQRTLGRICHRDYRRVDDGLRGAGAAVWNFPAADHDFVFAAALDRRRDRGAAADRQAAHHAGVDRHPDADGHRH